MISEKEELLEWRKRAAAQPAGRVVLDLEADSLHRYQEKICLIQYADETGSCLIDPLSIEDMGPFYNWLKETEVWMHGADYDMSLFQNAWETLPAMIWDTQTAARLLGFRQFGLAALVEHFHGITLSKSSQKADWARRPLSPTMVTYALNDVNYMLDMADKLTAALREKGRMGWFEEICRHSMERARDAEAKTWDKPAFMVCSNADLIQWSVALQEQRTVAPPPRFHAHRRSRFMNALQKFYLLDEEDYPCRPRIQRRQHSDQFEDNLARLCKLRDEKAEELGMEGSFLITRASLEAIAEDREKGVSTLLNWQKEALGF